MADLVVGFQRAQTDQRIKSTLLMIGLGGSLLMALPMMIGFKGFIGLGGGYVFFPLPFVACFALARLIVFIRNRRA